METENINVDEFLPAKNPVKIKNVKQNAESGETMEVEEQTAGQKKSKRKRSKLKKVKRSTEPNESKVNMRKVAVPAHRYNLEMKIIIMFLQAN